MPILSESEDSTSNAIRQALQAVRFGGLYLKVSTSGAKLWRFKYHFGPS